MKSRTGRASRGCGASARLRVAALALATVLLTPQHALAQQQFVEIDVPAGALSTALNRMATQAGLQIGYDSALLDGRTTAGLSGRLTAEEALGRLLSGTGVRYSFANAKTVTLTAPGGGGEIGADEGEGVVLAPIVVTARRQDASSGAGYQGTPDWVYETPDSVSVISREAIKNGPARNTRDLLDNVAGVYANRSEAQNPGISVNIRGLQDQDRIVTMIDGARQSFQRAAHGSSQRTYVDSAFLREIDVEKSSGADVGSLGSLGGSVNFRTLEAGDLIEPGREWGAEVSAATGTNGFYFDGSAVGAVRFSDRFSLLAGVSVKNIGPYEVGKNGDLEQTTTYDGDTLRFSGQETFSTLLKAEIEATDDIGLAFGWLRNNSEFSTGNIDNTFGGGALAETKETVVNDTFSGEFAWDPESDLIDLNARLYFNRLKNESVDGDFLTASGPSDYTMATLGGSIENTSRFDTGLGDLSLSLGGEAFNDDGETQLDGAFRIGGVDYSDQLSGSTPSGKRLVAGGFASAKLEHDDWLTVEGGLRYDWYHIDGSTTIFGNEQRDIIGFREPICLVPRNGTVDTCIRWLIPPNTPIYGDGYYTPHQFDVDRSDGALLPSATIAVKPFDWLQPFAKYSKSFRPPTIMESFLNGGHGAINGYAPNPSLEPERGETIELGVNVSLDGVIWDDDSFRLKVVGFRRDIDDYIAFGRYNNAETDRQYTTYVNLNETTRMKGVEIEANYDARSWYVGGNFTYNESEFDDAYGRGSMASPTTPVVFKQPERRFAVDAGVRLLDETLTLGGRMTYVGETEPAFGTLTENGAYTLESYRLYDVYGAYEVMDGATLRLGVNNVADKAYVSATGVDFYAAPGRTGTLSLNVKF